jgi:hypothetical protein
MTRAVPDETPKKVFLDAVDRVLNSNTFLLPFATRTGRIGEDLRKYLESPEFQREILKQDVERGWHNLQYSTDDAVSWQPKPGQLLKKGYELIISSPPIGKQEYLVAMLTANLQAGNFFSPYGQQLDTPQAVAIVDTLVEWMFGRQPWQLCIVNPDFLYSADDFKGKYHEALFYFEGERGCDHAIVLQGPVTSWLLLTNGIP